MKIRRNKFKGLVAAIALTATVFLAAPGFAEGNQHGKHGEARHQKMMQRMQENLDLTDQQVTQIKAIFESHKEDFKRIKGEMKSTFTDEQRQAMKEMRQSRKQDGNQTRPTKEERQQRMQSLGISDGQRQQLASLREQMKSEREEMKTEMAAVLTPDQQAKLEEMKSKWKGKRGKRGRHHQGESE
jgi:protein CpxP